MPKAGRPRKHGRAALSSSMRIRILRTEKEVWRRAAKAKRKSLSEWVRLSCNEAVTRAAPTTTGGGPGAAAP